MFKDIFVKEVLTMKDIKDLKLKLVKYKVDYMKLKIEGYGEFEVNPLYVGSMLMEKDYEEYNFPYFELMVGLPIKIYRAMKKKNIKVHCYLRIKYAYFKIEQVADEKDDEKPQEKVYMAKNFFVYGIEATPENTEEFEELVEKTLKIEDEPGELQHMVSTYLLLYDEANLNKVTTIFNEVITDCTLTDAVTRVLNLAGFKNVLMTPADNGKNYHEFTLLPIRTDEQLEHICNDFHMHKTGTRIFYDFEYIYIVSRALICDAWRPNEYKKTYIIYDPPVLGNSRTQGCCEDASDKSNYCTMCEFRLATPTYMEEQAYGTSYTHLDSKTGAISNVVYNTKKASGSGTSPSRMIYNNSGEASTSQQMGINQENSGTVWEVLIDSVYIEFLTPNKEFELVFLSSKLAKYNGRYKIVKFFTNFNKEDGEWYTTTTKAMFKGKHVD